MLKASQIDTSTVQPSDIGRAYKCFDGSIPFYMVQSSRDELVEYKVTHDSKGFHCTCPSGQVGFSTYPTIDTTTRARIEAANERAASKPASRTKAPEPRGFSLLR